MSRKAIYTAKEMTLRRRKQRKTWYDDNKCWYLSKLNDERKKARALVSITCLCLLMFGCITKQAQPPTPVIAAHRLSSNVIAPSHYHKVTWSAAHWMDDNDNYVEDATPIEYSVYSTTNMVNWGLETITINTSVFVTNDFPHQYYSIGAHAK